MSKEKDGCGQMIIELNRTSWDETVLVLLYRYIVFKLKFPYFTIGTCGCANASKAPHIVEAPKER